MFVRSSLALNAFLSVASLSSSSTNFLPTTSTKSENSMFPLKTQVCCISGMFFQLTYSLSAFRLSSISLISSSVGFLPMHLQIATNMRILNGVIYYLVRPPYDISKLILFHRSISIVKHFKHFLHHLSLICLKIITY